MDEKHTQRLLDLLFYRFEADGTSLFALLDAARDPRVFKLLNEFGLERECLFSGRLDPALRAASPYILRIMPGSSICQTLIEQGWGQSWGIFLAARAGMHEVRHHLRTFLQVQTEDRKKLFFRYFDPRVMRVFLPTCDATQLRQIFGPIQRFDMEGPDSSQLLRFRIIPEPDAPMTLRSWTYPLSDLQDAVDDRGSSITVSDSN